MPDPFVQALRDEYLDQRRGPLVSRRGDQTRERSVGDLYFGDFTADGDSGAWLESWLDGPLLDMGAGIGRHSLYFQERFETVAIEPHRELVETMRERGVEDAQVADMFSLRESFGRDRFQSALAVGTQMSLGRSMQGLHEFLGDLAWVTTPDGTAVVDGFDPDQEATQEMLDYYDDSTEGLAYRVLQFEYDGSLGDPWLYRLFAPDRVREAAVDTGWEVAEVRYGDDGWGNLYSIALEKA